MMLDVSIAMRCHVGMELVVRDLATAEDAAAFRRINEGWIGAHFALEDEDRRQLADPVAAYVDPGGAVLVAELDGAVVGGVALVPDGSGAFELSKMGVDPAARGRGIGRRVLRAAIERARQRGGTSVFLGSSTKLPTAVRLYEQEGFVHVPRESLHMPFARASVFMRLDLAGVPAAPAVLQS